MPPQRTLFINLYTEMGGGEYGLYHLLEHIDRSNVEPLLLVNRRGPLTDLVEQLGIEVFIVPFEVVTLRAFFFGAGFGANLRAARQIKSLVTERGIGAVVCSDCLTLLLLLPTLLAVPLRVFYNVIFFYELPRRILFNLLAIPFVDHIAVLSGVMERDLLRSTVGLSSRVSTIHWGVDTEKFRPRSAEERARLRGALGLPLDRVLVGFIGRYEVWKGHLVYLEAMEHLCAERQDVTALMVGGAMTESIIPEVAAYHARVKEKISEFAPSGALIVWDHRNDVPDLMAVLDVVVCPSDREPYGLVVLEALASGACVVATSEVGALEVVKGEKRVFVAAPRDSESLAMAVKSAIFCAIERSEEPKTVKTDIIWPHWRDYSMLVEGKIGA